MQKKLARPVSLLLALVFILTLLTIVGGVVIPELSATFVSLGGNVEVFLPKVQSWAEEMFQDNPQIVSWIESLELNWQKMLESGWKFLQTGAGSVLSSTVNVARTIISGVTTFLLLLYFLSIFYCKKRSCVLRCAGCCRLFSRKSGCIRFCMSAP